jgi:polyhydroxybutyrate depolymerase
MHRKSKPRAVILGVISCSAMLMAQLRTDALATDPDFVSQTLSVGGDSRSYLLLKPNDRGAVGRPLVILLHGNGGSSRQLVGTGDRRTPFGEWRRLARRANWVVAVPDGAAPTAGGARGWNDCRADTDNNPQTDDVAFLSSLIDSLIRDAAVDANRVFLLGHSNGGHLALRMAIEQPSRVRAFAAVAAAMPAQSECASPHAAVPAMFVSGTADLVMPFEGGRVGGGRVNRGTVLSTVTSVATWAKLNGSRGEPNMLRLPDRDRLDRSTVTRLTYRDALRRPIVVFYRVDGGGHMIPTRLAENRGLLEVKTNHDFETADAAFEFFSAHSKQ